jgi:hypothetical protein
MKMHMRWLSMKDYFSHTCTLLMFAHSYYLKYFTGHGVFARVDIPKGQLILEYRGEFNTNADDDETGFKFYFFHDNKQCL